jgi:pyruvate,water dikinase
VNAIPDADTARTVFREAQARLEAAIRRQAISRLLGQGAYEAVAKLAATAGQAGAETNLITGYGGIEEMRLIRDLWAVSRDRLTIPEFVSRHGYHGPNEGELSSSTWREDPSPLADVVKGYGSMPNGSNPTAVEARQATQRAAAEGQLLAGLPRSRRSAARVALRMCRRYLPLIEVAKASFLMTFDVARAAARVIGDDLCRRGLLDDAEDVFYLTAAELLAPPADLAGAVAERRRQRAQFTTMELPDSWVGMPRPLAGDTGEQGAAEGSTVTGVGVSAGIYEGTARVVLDPQGPFEPGEILVCHTTDPSWCGVFFLAGAVVVDLGGPLSHGAIVARELGLPAVVNTRSGTRSLKTGDRLRVDGSNGVVERLTLT